MSRTHPNPLSFITRRWQLLGLMAVAFAREITLMQKMRARSGAHKAALLEAWIYAAAVKLSADISVASDLPRLEADERAALAQLKTLHQILLILALLISEIKREFAAEEERLSKLAGGLKQAGLPGLVRRPRPVPFLDSG